MLFKKWQSQERDQVEDKNPNVRNLRDFDHHWECSRNMCIERFAIQRLGMVEYNTISYFKRVYRLHFFLFLILSNSYFPQSKTFQQILKNNHLGYDNGHRIPLCIQLWLATLTNFNFGVGGWEKNCLLVLYFIIGTVFIQLRRESVRKD